MMDEQNPQQLSTLALVLKFLIQLLFKKELSDKDVNAIDGVVRDWDANPPRFSPKVMADLATSGNKLDMPKFLTLLTNYSEERMRSDQNQIKERANENIGPTSAELAANEKENIEVLGKYLEGIDKISSEFRDKHGLTENQSALATAYLDKAHGFDCGDKEKSMVANGVKSLCAKAGNDESKITLGDLEREINLQNKQKKTDKVEALSQKVVETCGSTSAIRDAANKEKEILGQKFDNNSNMLAQLKTNIANPAPKQAQPTSSPQENAPEQQRINRLKL